MGTTRINQYYYLFLFDGLLYLEDLWSTDVGQCMTYIIGAISYIFGSHGGSNSYSSSSPQSMKNNFISLHLCSLLYLLSQLKHSHFSLLSSIF
jgi:hypothetical protein